MSTVYGELFRHHRPMNTQDISALRERLAEQFKSFVDPAFVLAEESERKPYECDGLAAYRHLPLIVVLPETINDVQKIMRICHAEQVPVVARGAGTGLSGGALPLENGVLLSLARFNQILDIDKPNLCAAVRPGVRNLAIS